MNSILFPSSWHSVSWKPLPLEAIILSCEQSVSPFIKWSLFFIWINSGIWQSPVSFFENLKAFPKCHFFILNNFAQRAISPQASFYFTLVFHEIISHDTDDRKLILLSHITLQSMENNSNRSGSHLKGIITH